MNAPRSHVCFFMVFRLITAYPCTLLPTNRQALILEAVAKHKNFITASQLIKASLNCSATYCKKVKTINIQPTPLKAVSVLIGVNNFVSISVQLHYHRNFQKTHYPEISVQSPGSNRASASRLRRLFKRNRLCVL